jgi:HSP20 family molecular chaperone IbpA
MSLFRPFFSNPLPSNDFSSLLNLLDQPIHHPQSLRRRLAESQDAVGAFTPRFDIKETKSAYELHGELPGIEQKNVDIEWGEGNTLTVHGRTEYTRTDGTPPKVEEEGWETAEVPEAEKHNHYHKPTIEDSDEPGESSTKPKEAEEKTEVVKAPQAGEVAKEKQRAKYWITERAVGEFHRSFSFPHPVDHDGVKATLKNGVLTVTVPKMEKPKVRRINVE